MKKSIKVISFLLSIFAITMILPFHTTSAASTQTINYYLPQKDEQISDDTVMVVFNNETSMQFINYDINNFNDIQCEDVVDLSTATANIIKNAKENITRHVINGETLNEYNGIPFSEYRQVICLKLKNKGKSNVIKAIKSLKSRDDVFYVGPDFYLEYDSVISSDSSYINDPYVSSIWGLGRIEAEKAWSITYGSRTVKVAVIDSGINAQHNDLSANIDVNLSRDCLPYPTQPQAVTDESGHGTMVAGVIGAVGGNGIGSCGVSPLVSLVSLKIEDADGKSLSSYAAAAINYATQQDIPIINMSLSWSSAKNNMTEYGVPLMQCIQQYPGIFICSAGNKNLDNDIYISYPSSYDLYNIITVGACTSSEMKWIDTTSNGTKGSNYGLKSVDLFAPGAVIYTTSSNGGYEYTNGTSLATPYVAGVAALMLAINPNLSTALLKDIILRSVDVKDSLKPYCVTGGRLNAYKAVSTSSNLRFDYRYSYNSLDDYTHGVICDTCECSCRNDDYSCGSGCDFGCDPCDECHLYYTELHYWTYWIIQGNVLYHTARCRDCGYSKMTAHNWVSSGSVYVCTLCEMTSTYAPIIPAALPPVNDEQDLIE